LARLAPVNWTEVTGMPTSFAVGHVNVFAAEAVPWDSHNNEQQATTKPASFRETAELIISCSFGV
jgi:hypothetical protein